MLALFRDIESDRPQAIQRIALGGDLKKIGSLSLGPTRNAAIKIYDHAAVAGGLCIAEGLETALSGRTDAVSRHGARANLGDRRHGNARLSGAARDRER